MRWAKTSCSRCKPGEQMVHIVHQRLIELMGPVGKPHSIRGPGPHHCHGLRTPGHRQDNDLRQAWRLGCKRNGKSVLVAAADLQRPAAVEQLRVITEHRCLVKPEGNATRGLPR